MTVKNTHTQKSILKFFLKIHYGTNPKLQLSRLVNIGVHVFHVLILVSCTGIGYQTKRPELPQLSQPAFLCNDKTVDSSKMVGINEIPSASVLCKLLIHAGLNVERNIERQPKNLLATERQITALLKHWGFHVNLIPIVVPRVFNHSLVTTHNIEVDIPGEGKNKNEIVVIGAHYDSAIGSRGANDNGTGVTATLELARRLKLLESFHPNRTIRFVFFTNEEEPYFGPDKPEHEYMGSRHYAKMAKLRKDNIAVMMSLETMGYYSDQEGSQCLWPAMQPDCAKKSNCSSGNFWVCIFDNHKCPDCQPQTVTDSSGHKMSKCLISASGLLSPILWPFGLYQPKGDFILFGGNLNSKTWIDLAVTAFRNSTTNIDFPAEAVYSWWNEIPGVNWSDHRSFWEQDYEAFMVTDTAPNRDYRYHREEDDVGHIQFERLENVVSGLVDVVQTIDNGLSQN